MTTIQKTVAFIFGIVFLLVGILGFVPALTPNMSLLGLFMVNPLHSIVHLAFGVLGIAAALTGTRVLYNRIGGLIYLVLGILGFFPFLYFGSNMLIGLVMINPAKCRIMTPLVAQACLVHDHADYTREPAVSRSSEMSFPLAL